MPPLRFDPYYYEQVIQNQQLQIQALQAQLRVYEAEQGLCPASLAAVSKSVPESSALDAAAELDEVKAC